MPVEEKVAVTPLAFCTAVQQWLATSPAENTAPPLRAAGAVAKTMEAANGPTFERELLRLAFRESVADDGQAEGAHVLLHLWQALGPSPTRG